MSELWDLFVTFFRIGILTFGGGYAMLPMIQREVVDHRGWATEEEVLDYYAVGQCTPGVIAVNTATFIGYKRRGVAGGIAATVGVICPSLIIITIIAAFLRNFAELAVVQHAFNGIRVCVSVLVCNAVFKLWKSAVRDKIGMTLFCGVFLLTVLFDFSPVFVVIGAISLGLLIGAVRRGRTGRDAQ